MTKLVRAAVLTNYLDVAHYLGFNPHDVLAQVGLSKARLLAPEQRIPIDSAVRLLELSAAATGCQTFGLSMAESRQLSDFGVVSLLLTHQRTLRDALQVLVHYRHLMNDSLAIFVEEAGKMVIIREEVVTESPMSCRQANELAIGVMFRLCAALLREEGDKKEQKKKKKKKK
ncbi:AraC family transcriptional regulator, partial [Pseudomonas sp. MWU12-2312b]